MKSPHTDALSSKRTVFLELAELLESNVLSPKPDPCPFFDLLPSNPLKPSPFLIKEELGVESVNVVRLDKLDVVETTRRFAGRWCESVDVEDVLSAGRRGVEVVTSWGVERDAEVCLLVRL